MGRLSKSGICALAFTALAVACGLSVNGTGDVLTVGGGNGNGDGASGQAGALEGGVQAQGGNDASDVDSNGGGSGTDDDAAADTGTDAPVDAGVDAKSLDAGAYRCGMTTTYVNDCSKCSGGGDPLLCVMCGAAGAREFICVPFGSSCEGDYRDPGYDYCPCQTGDAAACILPQQECNPFNGGVCVTCGETGTGYGCKGGGTCNKSQAKCQ